MITQLIKIYDETCDICALLKGLDAQVAEDNDLYFREITLEECAWNPSTMREHVIENYVDDGDGKVDIPIYMLLSQQGKVEASGVVKSIEELKNLISAWKSWESSQK